MSATREVQADETPEVFVTDLGTIEFLKKAAALTANYVSGPYRYEHLDDASHWIPEQLPDTVVRVLLEHLTTVPASAR